MASQKFLATAATLTAITAGAGCAARFQQRVVDRAAVASVGGVGGAGLAVDVAVPATGDRRLLRYVLELPRAMKLRYRVACPTRQTEGTVGETGEAYRARRFKELQQERAATAGLIGSVVGQLLPPVRATAGAGRGGPAVQAGVDPGGAAAAVAAQALPPVQLPPGDTGARTLSDGFVVPAGSGAAGRCAMTWWPEPPAQDASGVRVSLELVQEVDVVAEQEAQRAAVHAAQDRQAWELRAWLRGALQRAGADPSARARAAAEQQRLQALADEEHRRIAEARRLAQVQVDERHRLASAAAQAAADAARARADDERRRRDWQARQPAWHLRWGMMTRLVGLGADPAARARAVAAAQEQARHQRDAALAARDQADAEQQRQRQARAVARAQEDVEARVRAVEQRQWDLSLRRVLLVRLIQSGADPDARRHHEEAIFHDLEAQAQRDAQARVQAAARARADAEAAWQVRVATRWRLHAIGAIDRPPCPPAPAESPPPPPFVGAVWVAGRHEWTGAVWLWRPGFYARPSAPGVVWVGPLPISIDGTLVITPERRGAGSGGDSGRPPRPRRP